MTGEQKHALFSLLMLPKIHFNSWRADPTLTQLELSMCRVYFQSAESHFYIRVALNFPLILIVWKAKADGKEPMSRGAWENMERGLGSSGVHPNTKNCLQGLALSLFSQRCTAGPCQKGALRSSAQSPSTEWNNWNSVRFRSEPKQSHQVVLWGHNFNPFQLHDLYQSQFKLFCCLKRSSSYSFGFLHIFTVLKKHLPFLCILSSQS